MCLPVTRYFLIIRDLCTSFVKVFSHEMTNTSLKTFFFSFSTISLVLLHHITNITALILHTTQDKPIKTPRQSIKTDTFMLSFRTSLILNIGFKSSLQLSVETPNQSNSGVQSEERFTSSLANENSKWKQVHCLKRGKTPMTRSRLILVCIWLVGRIARVFLDQSQQKVFSKTKTISDYF